MATLMLARTLIHVAGERAAEAAEEEAEANEEGEGGACDRDLLGRLAVHVNEEEGDGGDRRHLCDAAALDAGGRRGAGKRGRGV